VLQGLPKFPHKILNFKRVGRLDQMQVEARLLAAPPVLLEPVGRNRNEQKGFVSEHGPQFPGDLIPVHTRHGNVEQHGIRLLSLCCLQGRCTVKRYGNFVPIKAQQHGHAFHVVGVVVHHKDMNGSVRQRRGQLVLLKW